MLATMRNNFKQQTREHRWPIVGLWWGGHFSGLESDASREAYAGEQYAKTNNISLILVQYIN